VEGNTLIFYDRTNLTSRETDISNSVDEKYSVGVIQEHFHLPISNHNLYSVWTFPFRPQPRNYEHETSKATCELIQISTQNRLLHLREVLTEQREIQTSGLISFQLDSSRKSPCHQIHILESTQKQHFLLSFQFSGHICIRHTNYYHRWHTYHFGQRPRRFWI